MRVKFIVEIDVSDVGWNEYVGTENYLEAADRLRSSLEELIDSDHDSDFSIDDGFTVRTKQVGAHILF